jgi:hypothetical protein
MRIFVKASRLRTVVMFAFFAFTGALHAQQDVGETKKLQDTLKASVVDSQKKLGVLEPWQKKIFEEEVLSQYQRFVQGYRASTSGVQVEVDLDGLRKYLAFYAPKSMNRSEVKILVLLNVEESCSWCMQSVDAVRKLVKARLERRGFVPVWLKAEELGAQKISGNELNRKIHELAVQKGLPGTFVVEWRELPTDALDTAHADELRFQIQTYFIVREDAGRVGSARSGRELKFEAKLELLETDSIEASYVKLFTDAMVEFGALAIKAKVNAEVDLRGPEEILLTVKGVKNFSHFTRFKEQLAHKLKDAGYVYSGIEERKLDRERIELGIGTKKTTEELKKVISGMMIEVGQLTVTDVGERLIQVEIR